MSFMQLNKFFLSVLFFTLCLCFCQGQVSKKTYQTIMTGNAETIKVSIEGATVELKETKGTRILVETKIQLSLPNEALLNFVVESGRYELVQTMNATTRELSLESKKNKNVIVVKGENCEEDVIYTIYIPASIKSFKQ
jgi:hypothetical protein